MLLRFTTPGKAKALRGRGARVVDVSSRAPIPYCYLSPFYPHGNIPVPGMEGRFSDSVEGVWQGLKVVSGHINESYFSGPGKKRGVKPKGHQYGDRLLDYLAARKLIYIPTYRRMVYGAPMAKEAALGLMREALELEDAVYVYDVDTNAEVEDLTRPLAHAAVLVIILNDNLRVFHTYGSDADFQREYDEDNGDGRLAYPLADVLIEELKIRRIRDMSP